MEIIDLIKELKKLNTASADYEPKAELLIKAALKDLSARSACYNFLADLLTNGGAIVSSNDCSVMEIADAQARGRFLVIDNFGFVRRSKKWLDRIHKQDNYMQQPEPKQL